MNSWTSPDGVLREYASTATIDVRVAFYRRYGRMRGGWYPWLFEQLPLEQNVRILDVGCGGGNIWLANAARIQPGTRVVLGDVSAGIALAAGLRLDHEHFLETACHLDAASIPYADTSFGLVLCSHALYHFPDRDAALAECHRVLQSQGIFAGTTIGRCHMQELNTLLAEFSSEFRDAHFGPAGYHAEELLQDTLRHFEVCATRAWCEPLTVTDADDLVDFVLASNLCDMVMPHHVEFRAYCRKRMERQGSLTINSRSDLVIGRKRRGTSAGQVETAATAMPRQV